MAQEPRAERQTRRSRRGDRMTTPMTIDERPVVVRVRETITSVLVGHEGLEYQSPPQPRAEALALVALLLGRGGEPQDNEVSWRCPIAGGQRTITIEPLSELETPGSSAARR